MSLEAGLTFLESPGSSPLPLAAVLLLGAVLPVALMATTCMLKISIVFAVLRSALGAGQIPSAAISTVLSIVLTWYVMSPVAEQMQAAYEGQAQAGSPTHYSELVEVVSEPLKQFMRKHTGEEESGFIVSLRASQGHIEARNSLSLLIPAFVLSQLREALLLGCGIFLPFLVLDLVVANLLVGLGMVMVSPMQISLPLKLLLFTLCDGWLVLTRSMVMSYQ